MEIRTLIAQTLERGKIDFSLWIEEESTALATPINKALVESYYQQIKGISETTGIPEPADWYATLMRMPDGLSRTEVKELNEEEWAIARGAVVEAVEKLMEFRRQEGAALEKKFCEKLDNIAALLASIEPYEVERTDKIRERILDSLQKSLGVEYDKNRFEQELIFYIEKLDINEEKQRLTNHLNYFRQTMNEGHGQGKKLGFIAQEMGREINTTGSKSNHAEMQIIVVKMKDELEQIKEQAPSASCCVTGISVGRGVAVAAGPGVARYMSDSGGLSADSVSTFLSVTPG